MTDQLQVPDKSQWPKWAVECFIHEGKICYKNEKGQTKYSNGRFVPGFGSGNPSGLNSDQAKRVLKVRSLCLKALEERGLPRIIKELSRKDLSARDLVAIVKFLAEQSIPKQIETDNSEKENVIPRIIISREAIDRAEELDKQYTEESGEA